MATTKKDSRKSETDWARVKRIDDGVESVDVSDIEEVTDELWANAQFKADKRKVPISFRLDADVLEFLKNEGPNYQTRMNDVLRKYMDWKQQQSK